ncbi:MAG TPA: hypothetical protein VML75_15725 [Kofleriaceae bacterium]|nr:hypothetical protein [Kofleriaceae bacterium]
MIRHRLLVLSVFTALSVAACEKASETANPANPANPAKQGEAEPVDRVDAPLETELDPAKFPRSPTDKPILALLGAGTGSRAPLRLAPAQGTTQKSTMAFSGSVAGQQMNMRMDLTGVVTRVKADGSFDVEATLDDVDMSMGKQMGAAEKKMVKDLLADMGMKWTFTARGDIEHQEITGSMAGLMDQGFGQLFLSLPTDAVGVGASWTVNDTLTQNGMTVLQQIHYEVTAIKGTTVELDMTLRQKADNQTVQGFKLDKLRSTGTGVMVIDTTKALPQAMKLDLTMDMTVSVGGSPTNQSSKLRFDWTAN